VAEVRCQVVAVYVFRRPQGRIELLQLRRSHESDYPGSWQPVYGHIAPQETAVAAALRELSEETGLRPRSFFQLEVLESFYYRPGDYVSLVPVFAAEVEAQAVPRLDRENTDWRWVPADQVEKSFLWRSQRQCVGLLLEVLESPGLAWPFLQVEGGA
jgi:8-oxo-dGTP pyrophosphatase MutT (NUDIX family)